MYDLEYIQNKVKKHLKPSRYKHTLGVMHFAVHLAEIHGASVEKAQVAALLHDYAKYESDDNILTVFEEHGIPLHPVIRQKPNLGHAQVSAILATEVFHIHDEAIIKAISHHTFGCRDMSKLEKIIYLADSLEENRQYDGVETFRALARSDLNQAIIAVSGNTMQYELKKGHMIHENTVIMRNTLMEEVKWT